MRAVVLSITVITLLLSCKTKQTTVSEKPCEPRINGDCVCIDLYEPVCGCDNKTYPNSCHAQCSGVTFVDGPCKEENKK